MHSITHITKGPIGFLDITEIDIDSGSEKSDCKDFRLILGFSFIILELWLLLRSLRYSLAELISESCSIYYKRDYNTILGYSSLRYVG